MSTSTRKRAGVAAECDIASSRSSFINKMGDKYAKILKIEERCIGINFLFAPSPSRTGKARSASQGQIARMKFTSSTRNL